MSKLIACLLLVFSSSLFAISEDQYAQEYKEKIIPLMKSFKEGTFVGEKNIKIHYSTYSSANDATKCLVILPGRTEPKEKYAEVVHTLDNGKLKGELAYFLMDHRGQGRSERILSKEDQDNEKGHVDDFDYYARDVKRFLDEVVSKHSCKEKFLLAHSLGAGIATDFLEKNPEYFDRAALSSPMLKIITAPYAYLVARSIVTASVAAGRGDKYAIGQKAFDGTRDFSKNTFTSSPARYEMAMGMFDLYPETRLGGVTNRWLYEVMKGTNKVRQKYDSIRIPLRVFHAGIESYSEPEEMIKLCTEARYCVRTFLETSKHEVMMDRDVNRDIVMNELEDFFR